MECEFDQHIMKAIDCIPKEVCEGLAKFFWDIKGNGITFSSFKDSGLLSNRRKDELVHIPGGADHFESMSNTLLDHVQMDDVWNPMIEALRRYAQEYGIEEMPLDSENWKIHCAYPTQGYHDWHHEIGPRNTADRVLAWMFLLEAPEEGGETEFLYQSKRIPPEVGNVLMWPAYFTHLHRGNPPIKGHKLYATGWFVSTYN